MQALPAPLSDWFDTRGWRIHPHQQAMLDRAAEPALLLIAPTGGGKTRVAGQSPRFLAETFRQILGSRPVYYLWCKVEKRHRALRTLASSTSDLPEGDEGSPSSWCPGRN